MGLLDGLEVPQRNRPCRVRTVLAELEPKDSKILADAIASPDWAARTLSMALKERGLMLSDSAISSHRKKMCSCGRID